MPKIKKSTSKKTKRLTPKKSVSKKITVKKTKTKRAPKKLGRKIKGEVIDILEDLEDLDDLDNFGSNGEEKKKEKIKYEKEADNKEHKIVAPKRTVKRSLNMYRSMAVLFVSLTVVLLAVVFYFYFVKVTIVVVPNEERISDNVIVDVYDKENRNISELPKDSIAGIVEQVEIDDEKVYKSTGEEPIGEEVVGMVTIVNNYSKNQPLVATTRLLSPKNELFRIAKTVNVPAGGYVNVEAYADEPSPSMAIQPTKFIIPGLWAGIQDKIYALNKEAFEYKTQTKKHITQDDIDGAVINLKQSLIKKAGRELGGSHKGYNHVIYNIDENSLIVDVDAKVGEEKEEFAVSMKARVNVVAFSEDQLGTIVLRKLMAIVPTTKKLLQRNKVDYALNSYDGKEGVASVNATVEGDMVLKEGDELIDKKRIVNLNEKQLKDYLDGFQEIAGYKINFVPSFIKRVPNLVDRIKVQVEQE